MNEHKENPSIRLTDYEPAAWLEEMLYVNEEAQIFNHDPEGPEQSSQTFRERCQRAAEVTLSIAHLSKERQRIGFVPLSLADYIQGLVKVTNVRLGAVLEWLQIEDLSHPTQGSVRAFVKLAQQIGISVREALIHIRIGFAARIDAAPVPLLLARYRATSAGRGQLEECETVLGQIESGYGLSDLRELRRIEFEVRVAYKEQDHSAA